MKHLFNYLKPYGVLFGLIALILLSVAVITPYLTTVVNAIHFVFAVLASNFLYKILDKTLDKIHDNLNKK